MENHSEDNGGADQSEINGNGSTTEGKHERGGKYLRVVIIGGSITGLSCAHALLKAGVCSRQTVTVLERARKLTSAGAGIGLDLLSVTAFKEWGLLDELLRNAKPMPSEEVLS